MDKVTFNEEREQLQKQADSLVFSESEMTSELAQALNENHIQVRVVSDDEYEQVISDGFGDWLIEQSENK